VFTIGHSNHPWAHFLELLRRHNVETVADVRSRPYSRFVPHFSKTRLERLLAEEGIGYLYFGAELGGMPSSKPPAGSTRGTVTYRSRSEETEFRRAIDRLLEAARARRIALMCRERDPLDCHRLHLICRHLAPTGVDIRHILPNGELEAQATTEQRLLDRARPAALPLFEGAGETTDRHVLEQAYDAWWQRSR
jgi:uncharacterized protein (DUF488 family)